MIQNEDENQDYFSRNRVLIFKFHVTKQSLKMMGFSCCEVLRPSFNEGDFRVKTDVDHLLCRVVTAYKRTNGLSCSSDFLTNKPIVQSFFVRNGFLARICWNLPPPWLEV